MLEVAVSQHDGAVEHGTVGATGTSAQTTQQTLRNMPVIAKELLAGGAAGGFAKTVVAPLERVKILFQTGQMRGRGVGETLVDILHREGPRGLFRGNGASVLRIVPYAALHFSAYEYYRDALARAAAAAAGKPLNAYVVPPSLDLLAGSAAGATAVLATYPLDLVRTRLAYDTSDGDAARRVTGAQAVASRQVPSHNRLLPRDPRRTIRGVLATTLREEGVRGLYRGIGPTMCGILPYAGLKFYVYQTLKQRYRRYSASGENVEEQPHRLPVPIMLTFGACSGLIAQTFTYPLDVVRRQMQVQKAQPRAMGGPATAAAAAAVPQQPPAIRSTWQGLRLIAQQQGLRALFAGLSLNYLKVVPSTAIGFTVYDSLKQYLGLPQHL